jgi:hypothetical protein
MASWSTRSMPTRRRMKPTPPRRRHEPGGKGRGGRMSLALKRCPERLASTNGGGRSEVSRSSTSRCSSCGVRWPMKRRSKRTAVIQVRFERLFKAALKTDQRSSETGGRPKPTRQSALRPGTHLVREWNGRTYQIEVLDDGFQMDGKRYRSLSAIARKITGAHWSGPRFFGLG